MYVYQITFCYNFSGYSRIMYVKETCTDVFILFYSISMSICYISLSMQTSTASKSHFSFSKIIIAKQLYKHARHKTFISVIYLISII